MAQMSELMVKATIAPYWQGNDAKMALEIARLESGFDATAHAQDSNDDSYGLMQINMLGSLGPDRRRIHHLGSNLDLFNPMTNMRVAKEIWELNGNSFMGSAAWSTSATRAKEIVGGTGGTAPPEESALSAEDQKIWDAIPATIQKYYKDLPLDTSPLPRHPDLTDEQWRVVQLQFTRWQGGLTALDDIGLSVNPIEWAAGLGQLLTKLLDPSFWKLIGLGALAFVVIILGFVLWNADTIKEVAP